MRSALTPLFVTLAIQALASMAALTVPVLAPEAAADTGYPAKLAGVFIGLVYAGAMGSSLISGALIDRLGPVRVSQICLLLCAAGLLLAASGMLAVMGLGALVIGLGYGPVTPSSSHLLARTTPPHRMGLTFSLKQTGVPLGGAMAGLTVPSLVSGWGWQQALVVVAGLCAVMAALSQPVRGALDGASADDRRAQAPSRRRGVFEPLRMILERPPLRDIALCSFFYSAVQLTVTTYMVIWLTEVYRMEFLLAGVVMAFAQGAGVVGRLLWGWLADRHVPPRVLLSFLGLIMAACMAGYAMTGPDWALGAVLVIAIASGATAIGWNGVYLAEVARLSPPGMAGMLTGGTLFFTYFGVVTVPPALAGIIGATGSFAVAFGAVAVITLAVAAYIGLTRPRLVAN
ncbi:Sugar phosphate permease [Paracoccus alkenifer]|uniref:Sugar phosphate permease n=1 Tax=Paracoccus alkenifer TaxID=65735 RepID=A0A1H6K8J1_9RHOB|nr:Sugar phosphate permease [Paracoccus alkenifer]